MKIFLHPDYWVEVPAGEFLIGLSDTQRDFIRTRIRNQMGYERFSASQRRLVESAIAKFRRRAESGDPEQPVGLSEEENIIWHDPFRKIFDVEYFLMYASTQTAVWVDRFYIARFPVIRRQYGTFQDRGTPPGDLPGALEEPPEDREVAVVSSDEVILGFCQALGGRLPDGYEWEKAARGTDGQLYPWGDEWDLEAGFFYYAQPLSEPGRVDAFPRGVSPYGVWGMAGGLPELVGKGKGRKGCHAKESSAETAWFDHILDRGGKGRWVSLRPVLDEWPRQEWPGFQASLAEPNAEALQKMGPLADLLLTQFNWSALETKVLDILEPAIVALREGRKAESQALLTEILHNDPDNEAGWLLQAAALEDVPKQRECVQRALAINPKSEIGWKMGILLKPPARTRW